MFIKADNQFGDTYSIL